MLSAFHVWYVLTPSSFINRYVPGLIMLATMNGPYHYDCSFPCLSGRQMRTRSPRLISFRITFLSLQALVSAWYTSRFLVEWSLDAYIISILVYRCIGVVASICVQNDLASTLLG
jgi:hypothetical protein